MAEYTIDKIEYGGNIYNFDIPKIHIDSDTYSIVGFIQTTISGISGVAITYDDGADNFIFLPDGNGFNTGSQAIINQIPTKTSDLTNDSGFLTSHQDISGKADKATTVSNIAYDSTNTKITKTINGTTSDVITIATLKTALGSMPASDVYSWAKASTKPAYTASEVGALPSSTTIPAITLNGAENTSPSFYAPTTAGTNGYVLKSNGSGAPTWTSATLTDEKVKAAALTSGTLYYPILATGTGTATRQIDSTLNGLTYKSTAGTASIVGTAKLTIGNSIASGRPDNEQGQIILYGSTAYAHTIVGEPTINRTITLPNASGTLALNTVVIAGSSVSSGGLMSQADKTKLDSIASDAAAIQIIRWTESS